MDPVARTVTATSFFGHDDDAEHAPSRKTVDDALELRARNALRKAAPAVRP
ncbi:hypothetical protein [Actinoplanes sp. NPDC051494]|uniref:hypothetical protein n=1 Tax=Actinoplanes sp. NPDC051494 TaxID=3363907 RepID=UPI0037A056A8